MISLPEQIEVLKKQIAELPDKAEANSMSGTLDKLCSRTDLLEELVLEMGDVIEKLLGTRIVELQHYRNKVK